MTITVELSPDTEKRLLAIVAQSGRELSALVQEAIEDKLAERLPTFKEILAPIQADFRASGLSEQELHSLLEESLSEVRSECRAARNATS
jgi:predicted transcriptional regulator